MRPLLPSDLFAAARALLPVPSRFRAALARRMVEQAHAAAVYCDREGRAHPAWGNGTLLSAAQAHEQGREVQFGDPDFLTCQRLVLSALLNGPYPEAQEIQTETEGSSARRFSAIASPQSLQ